MVPAAGGARTAGRARRQALRSPTASIELIASDDDPRALEALWATASLSAGSTTTLALDAASRIANEHVRRWTVRLLGDDRQGLAAGRGGARRSWRRPSPTCRSASQLASSAKRLPADVGLPIVRALAARSEDLDDLHMPLLVWWAIEVEGRADREAVSKLFEDPTFWSLPIVDKVVVERIMQRYAMTGEAGRPEDLRRAAGAGARRRARRAG